MTRKEIAKKLTETVVGIYIFHGTERLSRGSGFLFDHEGSVFTAAHVINNGRAFTPEELQDPTLKILVKIKGRPPIEYFQALPSLLIEGEFFKGKLLIDLTGLKPKKPLISPSPFLTTRIRAPVLGEDVLLAGFSDEMYPPFTFPHRLKPSLEGIPALIAAQTMGFDVELGMLMIKSGIVGSSFSFSFSGKSGAVKGSIFFIDSAMHSGASGGPVIDENGEAIGVITERAITRLGYGPAPDLYVPSGSTHAMNLEPLTAIGSVVG
jgi:hypothetical protein